MFGTERVDERSYVHLEVLGLLIDETEPIREHWELEVAIPSRDGGESVEGFHETTLCLAADQFAGKWERRGRKTLKQDWIVLGVGRVAVQPEVFRLLDAPVGVDYSETPRLIARIEYQSLYFAREI